MGIPGVCGMPGLIGSKWSLLAAGLPIQGNALSSFPSRSMVEWVRLVGCRVIEGSLSGLGQVLVGSRWWAVGYAI
jgi:hypothetical protein